MANAYENYDPSVRFTNTNFLLSNHFRFIITDLPDLTFYVQSVQLPDVSSITSNRPNPFTTIPEVGDHLNFSPLQITYLVDTQFKTYFSLFWWLSGYGHPTSYDDILNFNASRAARLPNPRPTPREIQKTTGMLSILRPDTDSSLADILFTDLFPTALGQLAFTTTSGEPVKLTSQATFHYTTFDVRLNPTAV
jgi:hypothetical protein